MRRATGGSARTGIAITKPSKNTARSDKNRMRPSIFEMGQWLRIIARSPSPAKAKTVLASTRVAAGSCSRNNVRCLLFDVFHVITHQYQTPLAPLAADRRLVGFECARRDVVGVFGHRDVWCRPRHGILPTNLRAPVVFVLRAAAVAHSNDR